MIELNKSICPSFLVVLFFIIVHFLNYLITKPFTPETSVWCFKGFNQSNICKFKNICYDVKFRTFLFFLGKGTVIKGFNHYSELQYIQLSSVHPHNKFYANLSVIDSEKYKVTKQLKTHSKMLLFSRFKPNNIMHTVHDDLFPIFLTLESICSGDINCMEGYSLMFHDSHPKGPFFTLYKLFSKNSPIIPQELSLDSNDIFCFEEMLTGLMRNGIFYQYGFKRPHGPIKPTELTQSDISRFVAFVKDKLEIHETKTNLPQIVLFSRLKNRKILNIFEAKQMIQNVYQRLNKNIQIKVIHLDLVSRDLGAMIRIISGAVGLIGMHGAEMILSLFMKSGSYVFEMFPFGINPDVVSFIKPVSQLEDSNFRYFSWRNPFKNNSVAHPQAHALFGGIAHLDERTQENIKKANEVPPVECCNDPLFLYHMYQDTWVSNEFREFLYESLSKTSSQSEHKYILDKWFYPDKVFNVSCSYNFQKRLLCLNWRPPFNVANVSELKYSVHVRDQKGLLNRAISTGNITLSVEVPFDASPVFEVWILAECTKNSFKGPDMYIKCP